MNVRATGAVLQTAISGTSGVSSAATTIHHEPMFDIRRFSPFLMPMLIVWALMVLTFSVGDEFPGGGTLDALLSKLKYGVRALALIVFVTMCVRRRHLRHVPTAITALSPLILFVGWAMLSTGWAARRSDSLAQAGTLAVLYLVAVTFSFLCRNKHDLLTVLRHLCTALFAISCGLLFLKLCLPSLGVMDRSGTGLFHATNTAGTASLGLVLLVSVRCLWHDHWASRLLIPAVPVHMAVLYLSANRLSLAIAICIIAFYALRYTPKGLLLLATFVGCCAAMLYLTIDPGFSIVNSTSEAVGGYASRGQSAEELSAFSGREEMWDVIWHSFLGSPWMGHGYFMSSSSGSVEVWYTEGNWTAHNTVLQVLVSTGVIGLLLLIIGLATPLAFTVWQTVRNPDTRRIPILLLTLAFWYLTWGLMNESFMGPLQPESVVFFSVLGMTTGVASTLRTDVMRHRALSGRAV